MRGTLPTFHGNSHRDSYYRYRSHLRCFDICPSKPTEGYALNEYLSAVLLYEVSILIIYYTIVLLGYNRNNLIAFFSGRKERPKGKAIEDRGVGAGLAGKGGEGNSDCLTNRV